jgi:hypothetical protein
MAALYPNELNVDNTPSTVDVLILQKNGETEVKHTTIDNLFSNNSSAIKSSYENNTDTNVYTDSEKTKVGKIESVTTLTSGANVSVDMSSSSFFTLTADTDFTFDNPIYSSARQTGYISIRHVSIGSRVISLGCI